MGSVFFCHLTTSISHASEKLNTELLETPGTLPAFLRPVKTVIRLAVGLEI